MSGNDEPRNLVITERCYNVDAAIYMPLTLAHIILCNDFWMEWFQVQMLNCKTELHSLNWGA